jgi:hypothetical protein
MGSGALVVNIITYGFVPYIITFIWFPPARGRPARSLDWDYIKVLHAISPYFWADIRHLLVSETSVLECCLVRLPADNGKQS